MFNFDTSYKNLPQDFFQYARAEKFPSPSLIVFNEELAEELGLDYQGLSEKDLALIFSGQKSKEDSPIAQAYAGHQFGNFVPQLGDGRAMLLGEVVTPQGERKDIQLKGSGKTPFSRRGDGKSSLGPVIREYILSEAMNNLGIKTTRALCAVKTGEDVFRDDIYPGGVFTRVASGHIRVGTFEYFASRGEFESVKKLADYAIKRHYPDIFQQSGDPYLNFFENVARAQVSLVTDWMGVGFIHGVMNTDNTAISGETLDYGPCAFMDNFEFHKVFSSIDRWGRYSYQNQGRILFWNLARLADCLIPLMQAEEKQAIEDVKEKIESFHSTFEKQLTKRMMAKLGIKQNAEKGEEVVKQWLHYLEKNELDFTLSFRHLAELVDIDSPDSQELFPETSEFRDFFSLWKNSLATEYGDAENLKHQMNSLNPVFIPRNHQVEQAIELSYHDDFSLFHRLNHVLRNPFTWQPEHEDLALAPKPQERVQMTFCGT